MALESGTHISELNSDYPTTSDTVAEGDDHIRLLKAVLKNQFSGLTGTTSITTTEAELNIIDGSATTQATVTLAAADGVVISDADVMKQALVSDFDTYVSGTTSTLTNKTLTAPKFADAGYIADANGNEQIVMQTTGTAVNALEVTNAATGGAVTIGAFGSDSNVDITITPKGTGEVNIAAGNLNYAGTAVTSTGAELNILDTVTATATELNYLDITTLGTVEASKTVTADSNATVNHADKIIQKPEIKDYAETVNAIGNTGGGSQSINLELGNVVTATQTASQTTYSFDNPSGTGKSCSFTLILTNGGSNGSTVFPTEVDWKDGTDPTFTSSGVDVFTFMTVDAGTIWYGFHSTDMK